MTAVSAHRAETGFRRLFEPLVIGNFTVRNRIVNTSHGTGLRDDRDLRYLQERARGGVGLMGVHAAHGLYSYAIGPGQPKQSPEWDEKALSPVSAEGIAFYDNVVIPHLAKRAEVIHAEGARCFAQVFNLGAARHQQAMIPVFGPSAVPDPYEAAVPHPLTAAEIEEIIEGFAHGIRRVRAAGFDAAEIHGAHGYLVNQFLSPYFNRRTDRWGATRPGRVQIVADIVSAARKLVGDDFPIGIRIGVDGDGAKRGITIEELGQIAALLTPHVQYISVSGGSYSGLGDGFEGAYVSPWLREPAFNAAAAASVKQRSTVPVFVTGKITDPSIAEGILADGTADMVGMVRALIADPELPNKAREGRSLEIRMCLGLSECHAIGRHRVPVTCAVNASAAREAEMQIVPAAVRRRVVVVGSGPAGLEAARVAALRGHDVYLCDQSREIGGLPRVLARGEGRSNLRDHSAYFETVLKSLPITFLLGNAVVAEELAEFGPDVVVVATGGLPMVPDVPGIGSSHVVQGLDLLRGAPVQSDRVVVVGGHDNQLGPPTIAEFLADQGKKVTLLSEQFDFAHGVEDGTRFPLLHRLANKKVTVRLTTKLVSVTGTGAIAENTLTRDRARLDDTAVVLACGMIPNDRLALELEGKVPEIHLVGDALAPRRIMHATVEGARVAMGI
jgi:2,4-dienoyl-CoA reductase-like NADH-dependent reductase (Old Yellow Enzyme family)/thioredoxin reductase